MKEDSQDRQLAMATKTPPLKRIRAFSNSFKTISARLKSQMLVNFPGVEFLRTGPYPSLQRRIKSNVQVLDGVEIAKKCPKMRVALCTCVDVARCFDYFCH